MSPILIWAILGIILLIAEVFTTTFFLLFFGIAALIVATAKFFGLSHLATELIIFGTIGLLGIVIFRKRLLVNFHHDKDFQLDVNQSVVLSEDIAANATGKILYRGTSWSATNHSGTDLKKGEEAYIKKIEGLKLILSK